MARGLRSIGLRILLVLSLLIVLGESGPPESTREEECYAHEETCNDLCKEWVKKCEDRPNERRGQVWCCITRTERVVGQIIAIIVFCLVMIGLLACCICFFAPCCPFYFRRKFKEEPPSVAVSSSKKASPSLPEPSPITGAA